MEEHGDGDLGTDGAGIFHPRPYTNKNDNGSSESLPPEVWAVIMECKCTNMNTRIILYEQR